MIVTTSFPCGNGRVRWKVPGVFEVESIAYSKSPRYVCFKVMGLTQDRAQEIVIRPDSLFYADFTGLTCKIWMREESEEEWVALDEKLVEVSPNAIRFKVYLEAGKSYYFSTEPFHEYTKSTQELFALAKEFSELADIHCIGNSIEHRSIFVLRVTEDVKNEKVGEESKPTVLIHAGEHATEFAGEEMVRGMLKWAISEEGKEVRRQFSFHFILNANPDGNFHGWHQYNAKDWSEHNYSERVDRSWHHEFEDFFNENYEKCSAETHAVGGWVTKIKPVFIIGAHSWLGHNGNPGAFYTSPALLDEDFGEKIKKLNRIAVREAEKIGVLFEVFSSSSQCGGHMGSYLMRNRLSVCYTIEGHMNLGPKKLRSLGRNLLKGWLSSEHLDFKNTTTSNWEEWLAKKNEELLFRSNLQLLTEN